MPTVLITGATGVIGSELVPLFLQGGFQVRLLLRGQSAEHVRGRMEELYAYWQMAPDTRAAAESQIEPIAGDVTQPALGLDAATFDRLAGELTHVVHAAGKVKLNQSIEEARRNALEPARQIVALARACQRSGQFVKLDAVTTIGVCGRMPGLIPERRLTEPRTFHNNYEQAKAETEDFLFAELDAGLPLTIHRPSMVVGRSDTGRVIRKQVFYYLCEFLTGKHTCGFLPNLGDATLDVIPVDEVARTIYHSSTNPETVGRVVHLCAGPDRALRLSDLVTQVRRDATARSEKLPQLHTLPLPVFSAGARLLSLFAPSGLKKTLRTLPYFLTYLSERQRFAVETVQGGTPSNPK